MATDYGSKIIRMHDEVARLLERAGIREPYDELRDADYGYRRMRIRQLFFGVGDARLRRRLIWLTREIDTLMPKLIQADYAETTRTLRASERKAI
ncbi:MAG: hypothetical protein R3357_14390, partial [Burkholderiales bacterium]|nr:hypothetical protein [Burkholderiales bacterium]